MRYTDYKQVRLLAKSILTDDKKMIALVEGLRSSLKQLQATFLDDGYDEVEAYANGLMQKLASAQDNFLVLAKELLEYADILESVRSQQGNSSSYSSPYKKTQFSGMVSYTDPQSKQLTNKLSSRTIYENGNIDPTMVVPAGTVYPNGRCVREDTTNLELMDQGKAPFVAVVNSDGCATLVQVELHHVSGEETQHGSKYFTGSERDGTLVEIAATVHDAYTNQLHIGNSSFRRGVDGEKTEDAAKYEKFRSDYWKQRARRFRDTQ